MSRPTEATLIDELQHCEQCASLWSGPTQFGPFPLCDADALTALPADGASAPLNIVAFHLPRAAPLHGCRKAPVMLVGINPNLTGFWTLPDLRKYANPAQPSTPKGCGAVYPYFRSAHAYARAYRYIRPNRHEYAMQANDVATLVDAEQPRLLAPKAGYVVPVDRDATPPKPPPPDPQVTYRFGHQRHITLQLAFDDGTGNTLPISWQPDENYVTVSSTFQAGDVIAGVMTAQSTLDRPIEVSANRGSRYYAVAQGICDSAGLELGEDVSMHDMVACASQKWGDDLERNELVGNCIDTQRYALRQFRQSRPALMVFSGLTAFELFRRQADAYLRPPAGFDLAELPRHLLNHAVSPLLTLTWPADADGAVWSATLVVVDHFSHPARSPRFDEGVRSTAWPAFRQRFPLAFGLIASNASTPPLATLESTAESWQVSPDTWQSIDKLGEDQALAALQALSGDPRPGAIAQIVQRMREQGALPPLAAPIDGATLARTEGDCSFCRVFEVAAGCPYGKGIENLV